MATIMKSLTEDPKKRKKRTGERTEKKGVGKMEWK